ncbi:DUF935 family protein [Aureispira sp. CCB-QB1]|uniref:phage portal protein family protein n=1 Tax=Aureispira sp. CCB-QB1 TaxID=1313421 RepID=UPI000696A0A7|nr:DUF935 family protein [Aureispira sp. CCB-QB1]
MKDKPYQLNLTNNRKISEQIIIEPTLRINPDIRNWRYALRNAEDEENPDRSVLYDIYEETTLDGLITSVTERIVLKCTNSKIIFKVGGQTDKEHPISKVIKTPVFLDIIRWIIESKWYGYSLIELDFEKGVIKKAELIARKNVIPEKGIVVKQVGDQEGFAYNDPPYVNYVLSVGKKKDLGLLNNATPYAIFKRFGISSWGEFIERFGLPIEEYQYDPQVTGAKEEVERQAKERGSGAKIIMPNGTSTKIHKGADGAGSTVFKDYKAANDEELLLIFLLQTMTTKDGSSRSQAEVHEVGENELIAGYKLFIEMVLNFQLKPILEKHGFDVANGEFEYEKTEKISKLDLIKIFQGLANFGDIPLETLEKHFGVKLTPKEKESIQEKKKEEDNQEQEEETKQRAKKKSRYNLACSCLLKDELSIETFRLTKKEENSLLERIYKAKGKASFDPTYFNLLATSLIEELNGGWNESKGIDYNSPDHLTKTLLELNLYRFSATKDIDLIRQANKLLSDAKSFNEFEQQVAPLFEQYNKHHLKTEFNLAYSTAQNTSNYLRNLEVIEDFPYWEYQTVGDDRVRPAHAALDGMVFKAGESGVFTPPNGFGCRCEQIPRDSKAGKQLIDEEQAKELLGDEFEQMKKAGFAVNRAASGFVFGEDQMYLPNFSEESLSFKNFGLAAYSKIKTKAATAQKVKRNEDQAILWFVDKTDKNDLNSKDRIRLLDYNKRPAHLDAKTLLENKSWDILDLIPKVLENPDEVYFKRLKKGYTLTLLQYYNPKPLVVELVITEKDTTIKSWSFASNINKARTGLLIKKA